MVEMPGSGIHTLRPAGAAGWLDRLATSLPHLKICLDRLGA